MAPSVYCPSAPMFQTLARNPSDRPTAISTRVAALTNNSGRGVGFASGATKNVCSEATGSLPRTAKMTAAVTNVSSRANTGEPQVQNGEWRPRGSSRMRIAQFLGGLAVRAAHQQADLVHRDFADRPRRRQRAVKDHGDA